MHLSRVYCVCLHNWGQGMVQLVLTHLVMSYTKSAPAAPR